MSRRICRNLHRTLLHTRCLGSPLLPPRSPACLLGAAAVLRSPHTSSPSSPTPSEHANEQPAAGISSRKRPATMALGQRRTAGAAASAVLAAAPQQQHLLRACIAQLFSCSPTRVFCWGESRPMNPQLLQHAAPLYSSCTGRAAAAAAAAPSHLHQWCTFYLSSRSIYCCQVSTSCLLQAQARQGRRAKRKQLRCWRRSSTSTGLSPGRRPALLVVARSCSRSQCWAVVVSPDMHAMCLALHFWTTGWCLWRKAAPGALPPTTTSQMPSRPPSAPR